MFSNFVFLLTDRVFSYIKNYNNREKTHKKIDIYYKLPVKKYYPITISKRPIIKRDAVWF